MNCAYFWTVLILKDVPSKAINETDPPGCALALVAGRLPLSKSYGFDAQKGVLSTFQAILSSALTWKTRNLIIHSAYSYNSNWRQKMS